MYEYLFPATVLSKLRPYRKLFLAVSILAFGFALLVLIENILFLSGINAGAFALLILPYFLSWILIIFGCFFARISYKLYKHSQKRRLRPSSAGSAWTTDSRPQSPPTVDESQNEEFVHIRNTTVSYGNLHSPYFLPQPMFPPDLPPSYDEVVGRSSSSPIPLSSSSIPLSSSTTPLSLSSIPLSSSTTPLSSSSSSIPIPNSEYSSSQWNLNHSSMMTQQNLMPGCPAVD